MSTVVRRVQFHSHRSFKNNFVDKQKTQSEMLAQKIVDMLPGSSVSRSFKRSFGMECDINNQTNDPNPLSCLSRGARIMKRPSSPATCFPRSSSPQPSANKIRSSHVSPDRPRQPPRSPHHTGMQEWQENTPPTKRSTVKLEDVTPVLERYGLGRSLSATEPRVLRPRSPLHAARSDVHQPSTSSGSANVIPSRSSSQRNDKSEKVSPYLTSSYEYYQPDFDAQIGISSQKTSSQTLIEVPFWREDDILTNKYGDQLGPANFLRPRPSVPQRPPCRVSRSKQSRSKKTAQLCVESDDEDYEDTSDAAYMLRHARLEAEE
uniref:Uncharacterized protein n=1 Tax=Mesocestoides corti TaxID=53468 RepID=A0A5K3F9D6_MESCO